MGETIELENGSDIEDPEKFCKSFKKQHNKFVKKTEQKNEKEIEKMSKHHPCQLLADEYKVDCANEYRKSFQKCSEDSSIKLKQCVGKKCKKALEKSGVYWVDEMSAKDFCKKDFWKQSKKYQQKIKLGN